MQLPFYDSNFFIGFIVMLGLSIDTFLRYRKSRNVSSLYIAIASLFLSLAMFFWGAPSLFTDDTKILSFFAFLGDSSQALMYLMAWILAIRAFLSSKPILKTISYLAVYTLMFACIADAAARSLVTPYNTTVVNVSYFSYDIVFASSPSYTILTALNSLALIPLGFYFWISSKQATEPAQKFRIKTLALTFLLAALLNIALPAIPINRIIDLKGIALSLIFLIIAVSAIISHYWKIETTKKKVSA
jgi:hypothetical protein